VVVTVGSRGDVAPFTGLASRLQHAGHQVVMAPQEPYADLASGCGLDCRPLPGGPAQLIRSRAKARSAEERREVTDAFVERLGMGVVAATASGADLLLSNFGAAPLSSLAAEAFGIPAVGTYIAPTVPTAEFPLPGTPDIGDRSGHENLMAGRTWLRRTGLLYANAIRRLRARLGLPAGPGGQAQGGPWPVGWPVCHGYSPAVVPRPADWPPGVEVTGYWWPARPSGWRPPSRLADFLQAGPRPVFIGFGSTLTPPQWAWLSNLLKTAVRRAGVRAVVQAWCGDEDIPGDDILMVGDVPHDWLFPQTAAVVHHAGSGTTAAGLRAGVPAVCVPVAYDQPFWAERLSRLGIAPPPVPRRDLTAGALASALMTCVSEPGYRERAADLARRINAEDGAAPVLALVGRLGS
jgi:sterol 3beta-glucosyltransferase